jgi:hypothetical protein
MQCDRYLIISDNGRWVVQQGSVVLGVFAGRDEAMQAAIAVACSSGRCGHQAEVLTKSRDGDFIPVWTFGLDSYSGGAL